MSGTGSSEPTFVIELPALRGLSDRGLLDTGAHSPLRWFIDQPVTEDAVDAALDALRERELLGDDPESLEPGLQASLEVLAQPLLRLRVVRVADLPRSVVTYSDGIGAVSLLTDGRELVVTPVQTHESIAGRIADGIARELKSRGPRVDLVGAEASLLHLVAPLASTGELDTESLAAAIGSLGGEVSEADAAAALAELTEAGWLERRDQSYALAAARAEELEALFALEAIDIIVTAITSEGEAHRTHRFQRGRDRVWRISPFIAGHDHPPAEDASDDVEIATLFGLSFVPQSKEMVTAFVFDLLGAERAKKKSEGRLGLNLRR